MECEILIGSSVSIAQGLNAHANQILKCFPTLFLVHEIQSASKISKLIMFFPCTKEVLCHCAEVAKAFQCCSYRLYFLHYDWELEISHQKKQSTLMKPEKLAECHQTLSSRVGSGNKTNALLSGAMHC